MPLRTTNMGILSTVRCALGEWGWTDHRWGESDDRVQQTTSQQDTSEALGNSGEDRKTGGERRTPRCRNFGERVEQPPDSRTGRAGSGHVPARPSHSDNPLPFARSSGSPVGRTEPLPSNL